jgi:hypothetical protein
LRRDLEKTEKEEKRETNEHLVPRPFTSNCKKLFRESHSSVEQAPEGKNTLYLRPALRLLPLAAGKSN